MDNLEEMDSFLETCSQPKLNQEEINNLNWPICRNEIKSIIKKNKQNQNSLQTKSSAPDGLPWGIRTIQRTYTDPSQTLLFQKIEEEGTLPKSFCEATVTPILKPDKDNTKKNYKPKYLI